MSDQIKRFFETVQYPFVIVGTLLPKDREAVAEFLTKLNVPVYLEGVSGIREDPRLDSLKINYIHRLWEISAHFGYPIDGILRIGGVPILRPWRDLETLGGSIEVLSLSHLPFLGINRGGILHVDLANFLRKIECPRLSFQSCIEWLEADKELEKKLTYLLQDYPESEPSLFYQLSMAIPKHALVYVGNSLPIREWDLAATHSNRCLQVFASRGLNGIDGQISTFLGMAEPKEENWGIFGDLTLLYDLAGPWILHQLKDVSVSLVIMNNNGGKIFSKMFSSPQFQNSHQLCMEKIADHWGLEYHRKNRVPQTTVSRTSRLLEFVPDHQATKMFWTQYERLADAFVRPVLMRK